jgi:hypothetical protein
MLACCSDCVDNRAFSQPTRDRFQIRCFLWLGPASWGLFSIGDAALRLGRRRSADPDWFGSDCRLLGPLRRRRGGCRQLPAAEQRDRHGSARYYQFQLGGAAGRLPAGERHQYQRTDGGQVFDGTNTRLRFGIAQCLEVLADVPTYFDALSGHADTGLTNITPAIKWQISPVLEKIDLSATFGVALPTGTKAITRPGVQPTCSFRGHGN